MKKLLLLLTFILSQGLIAAPIHNAAERGDVTEVCRILNDNRFFRFMSGNTVNSLDGNLRTPLYYAVSEGHLDTVRLFLDRGADINTLEYRLNRTLLHIAACRGHINVVRLLLNRGSDINARDQFNNTPLHEAAFMGHLDVVRLLLDSGANINAPGGRFNSTPLHEAASRGRIDVVKLLINYPLSDHTIANKDGKTPEEIARSQEEIARSPECYQDIADMLHDAPSVNEKILNLGKGLQLFAAIVANKEGVYEEDYNQLGTSFKYCSFMRYITNIRKEKKPSSLTDQSVSEDEAGPSGYHSDDEVSSIATEDLEEELQQQGYCSIQ